MVELGTKAVGKERRRFRRYQVRPGLSALVRSQGCCLACVIDISEGGVGLSILKGAVVSGAGENVELTLFDDSLERMWEFPCRLAHSSPPSATSNQLSPARLGIEFEEVTRSQFSGLGDFIRSYTVDWEIPVRLYFGEKGSASVKCTSCGRKKTIYMSRGMKRVSRAKVKCQCGRVFPVIFDYRSYNSRNTP